jgi:hypothetical protein
MINAVHPVAVRSMAVCRFMVPTAFHSTANIRKTPDVTFPLNKRERHKDD